MLKGLYVVMRLVTKRTRRMQANMDRPAPGGIASVRGPIWQADIGLPAGTTTGQA